MAKVLDDILINEKKEIIKLVKENKLFKKAVAIYDNEININSLLDENSSISEIFEIMSEYCSLETNRTMYCIIKKNYPNIYFQALKKGLEELKNSLPKGSNQRKNYFEELKKIKITPTDDWDACDSDMPHF